MIQVKPGRKAPSEHGDLINQHGIYIDDLPRSEKTIGKPQENCGLMGFNWNLWDFTGFYSDLMGYEWDDALW